MSGTTPANASAYGYTQYDQELKKSMTNLGVGKVDGLLACYNEVRFRTIRPLPAET
jgi:hypothetical protein